MHLQSDVTLNAARFRSDAASEGIKKLNDALMEKARQGPKWFEVITSQAQLGKSR